MPNNTQEFYLQIKSKVDNSLNTNLKGVTSKLQELSSNAVKMNSRNFINKGNLKTLSESKNYVDLLSMSLKEQKQATYKTKQEWFAAQQKVKEFAIAMKQSGGAAKGQIKDFEKLQQTSAKLKNSYEKQRSELHSLNKEYIATDKHIKDNIQSWRKSEEVLRQVENTRLRIEREKEVAGLRAENTERRIISAQLRMDRVKALHTANVQKSLLQSEKAKALSDKNAANLQKAANAYFSIKGSVWAVQQMVGKPLNFAIDAENLEIQIKKQAHSLHDYQEILKKTNAMKVPVSKTAKYHVVEEAMMGGIKDPQKLADFTQLTIKSSQAMQTDLHETTQHFLNLNNSLKLENVEQLNKVVNQAHTLRETAGLGKGGELELFDALNRTAPLLQGTIKNMDTGQLLAYITTMKQAGVDTEAAATGLNTFTMALADGSNTSKSHIMAMEKLKLNQKELAQMMQKNPLEAIYLVIDRINKLPAVDKISTITGTFGKSSIQAIAPLLSSQENLRKNIDATTNASMYAGRIDKEYAIQMSTTASKIEVLKNSYVDLATQVGTMFLPMLKDLIDKTGKIMEVLVPWVEKHQELSKTIGEVVAGLFGLTLAVKVISFASLGLTTTFTGVLSVFTKSKGAYAALLPRIIAATSASWAFTASLLANPITWVVVAIAAAGAALYLFFTKTELGKKIWAGVVDFVVSSIEIWKQKFQDFIAWFATAYEKIKGVIESVKNSLGFSDSSNELNINVNDKTNLGAKVDELNKNAKPKMSQVINYNYTSNIKADGSNKDQLEKASRKSSLESKEDFEDMMRRNLRLGFN